MVDKAQVENVLGRLPSVEAELGDPDVLKDRRRYLATLADYRFLKKLDYAYVAWQLGEATERELSVQCSAFFTVQLSHPYMTTGKTIV